MKAMNKNELLDYLARYGYPLARPAVSLEPERVLKNLLKQDDARLLEGFPVVFANMLREKEQLNWESPKWNLDRDLTKKSEYRLSYLLALSYLLLNLFGFDEKLQGRAMKLLSRVRGSKNLLAKLREPFNNSQPVKMDSVQLSTERLKNSFHNYVVLAAQPEEVQKKRHELELELLLSELFTPRQKELLRKRLTGQTFTKTEREYFHRVIKKRLKALASEELHQLAKSVILK